MSLLANLVGTSQRVAASSARRNKLRELAAFLKTLPADEIDGAAHHLFGEILQGRIGIAYKPLLAAAATEAASEEVLSILEVDRSLAAISRHVAMTWAQLFTLESSRPDGTGRTQWR